jgi:hypothetical protein
MWRSVHQFAQNLARAAGRADSWDYDDLLQEYAKKKANGN